MFMLWGVKATLALHLACSELMSWHKLFDVTEHLVGAFGSQRVITIDTLIGRVRVTSDNQLVQECAYLTFFVRVDSPLQL